MTLSSRVCPGCGALNSREDQSCHRCQRRFPGPLTEAFVNGYQSVLGDQFPLTVFFIVLCVAVYVLGLVSGVEFGLMGGLRRSQLLRWGGLLGSIGRIEPWRYLSAVFLHFGALHLLFNMLALLDFGRATEQKLGSARFVIVFVVTGIVGFVASDYWFALMGQSSATGGASGGLFGLVGAVIGYHAAARDPAWKRYLLRAAVLAAVLGFMPGLSVNNAAHIGGCCAGIALGYAFYKEARPWRLGPLLAWFAGLLVLASLGSLVLCQISPAWRLWAEQEYQLGLSQRFEFRGNGNLGYPLA